MGRWKAWALAWLLAATLSALLLQAASARGDELLVNGGFEDGVTQWIAKGGALQAKDGLGRDDSAAGIFDTDRSSYHYVGQCVPAWEGNPYTFQGYAAAPNETPLVFVYLLISWYGGAECQGSELDTSGDESEPVILEPPGLWHSLVLEIGAAPTGTRSARVRIAVEQTNATVHLDDFSFIGPSAPTPTPSPTPPATHTPLPTASPSPSPDPIVSPTPTPTAAPSPTAVPTPTEVPPTATPSPSVPTPTRTPSAVLANAGFEKADGEGRPLGWQRYGGELRRSSAAKRQGQFAAVFISRTASTKWAFQTVTVEGGEAYVFSGYALKNDADIESAYLRLSWYASSDASGRLIDSVDSTVRLIDNSPDFRFLTTGPVLAPSEAASAKVRLMLDPLSEAEGKAYFDDISFEETTMPPPTQTAVPSPSPEATQTPLSPPSETRQGLALSPAAPTAPAAEPGPPSSPIAVRPSPTALSTMLDGPEAAVSSRDGVSQSEAGPEGTSPRTPVLLYRERRAAQSIQEVEGIAAGADEHDGLSLIVLILVMAPAAATVAAAALFVWRRSQKRARPH